MTSTTDSLSTSMGSFKDHKLFILNFMQVKIYLLINNNEVIFIYPMYSNILNINYL